MGIEIGGNPAISNVGPILADNDHYMAFLQQAQNIANQQNQQQAADTRSAGAQGYAADMQNQALARQADWHAQAQAQEQQQQQNTVKFHNQEVQRQNDALNMQKDWHAQELARQAVNDPIQQAEAEARTKATIDNQQRLGDQFDQQQGDNEVQKAIAPLAQIHAKMVADGAPPEIITKSEQEIKDAANSAKQNRVADKAAASPTFQNNFAASQDVGAIPIDGVGQSEESPTIGPRKTSAAEDYAVWKNQEAEEEYADKQKQAAATMKWHQQNADSEKAAREATARDRADKIAEKDAGKKAFVQNTLAEAAEQPPERQAAFLQAVLARQRGGNPPANWRDNPVLNEEIMQYDAEEKEKQKNAGDLHPYTPLTGTEVWRKTHKIESDAQQVRSAENRAALLDDVKNFQHQSVATADATKNDPEGLAYFKAKQSGQTPAASGAKSTSTPVKVNSKADYDALPSGAQFIDATGRVTTKRG